MNLSDDVVEFLRQPNPGFIATVMPDGSPQVTEVWVHTDGEHLVINTVQGFAKLRNIANDPRVAVAVADRENIYRYVQIRGRVIDSTTERGAEHIEMLSQKYTGQPYQWYGGRDQVRVILTIEADSVSGQFG
ncbi:MAG: PPOX class F420-dependent oxidoreductase [Thermomicrobiales bacterium]